MTTNIYYDHIDDFDGAEPLENEMPRDVKRLIYHCRHTYHNRLYFFSPSEKQFYRYFPKSEYAEKLGGYRVSKRSLRYQFIPEEDDGTPSTPNIRDSIVVSDRFVKRVEKMNKLELPSMRSS